MKLKIAIDGPSGSGKSTLAKALAKKFSLTYIDTGALYRAVGLYVFERGIAKEDKEAVISCLPDIKIDLRYEGLDQHVILNSRVVDKEIRMPEISMYASAVSAIPEVRAFLLGVQKEFASRDGVIMDGRDIGTVIMPDAPIKLFLCATDEARAQRRFAELKEKGVSTSYEEVLEDIVKRDANDRNRAVAPAIPADDAVMLDNSQLSVEKTVEMISLMVEEKFPSYANR